MLWILSFRRPFYVFMEIYLQIYPQKLFIQKNLLRRFIYAQNLLHFSPEYFTKYCFLLYLLTYYLLNRSVFTDFYASNWICTKCFSHRYSNLLEKNWLLQIPFLWWCSPSLTQPCSCFSVNNLAGRFLLTYQSAYNPDFPAKLSSDFPFRFARPFACTIAWSRD